MRFTPDSATKVQYSQWTKGVIQNEKKRGGGEITTSRVLCHESRKKKELKNFTVPIYYDANFAL